MEPSDVFPDELPLLSTPIEDVITQSWIKECVKEFPLEFVNYQAGQCWVERVDGLFGLVSVGFVGTFWLLTCNPSLYCEEGQRIAQTERGLPVQWVSKDNVGKLKQEVRETLLQFNVRLAFAQLSRWKGSDVFTTNSTETLWNRTKV